MKQNLIVYGCSHSNGVGDDENIAYPKILSQKHNLSLIRRYTNSFTNDLITKLFLFDFYGLNKNDIMFDLENIIFNFKENDIYSHSLNYSLVEILNSDLNKNNFEYLLNAFATMVYTHDYRNFEMGGTPIIESCHIIDNYIPYFKEKHKIEICNFLVITDGIGNYIDNIYGNKSYGMKKISNYSRKYVRDTETKKLYKIDDNNDLLNIKLNIIRDKHKCNLIGFFVGSIQENQQIVDIYAQISERVDIKKSLKKNGCATIENVGYDEFHLVISQNVSNPKLVITKKDDKEVTTRTLTTAFTKFLKKKTLSKIVLSKFVERISKQVA